MKRDMDIIRSVIAELEAMTPQECNDVQYGLHLGMAPDEYARHWHLFLLAEGGFVTGLRADSASDGKCLMSPELTWAGTDLADLVREQPFYDRIKAEVSKKGIPLTIDAVVAAGKALIAASLG